MLSLCLAAAPALANHFTVPWFANTLPGRPDIDCTGIAGVYNFVEVVNEYDNSQVGTIALDGKCAGGVGFFLISKDCTWQFKRIKNEPDGFCEADSGWAGKSINAIQSEFYTIEPQYDLNGIPVTSVVGNDVKEFVFTIQYVPGLNARRLQGIQHMITGCDKQFSGYAIERDSLSECIDLTSGQFRNFNAYAKRRAHLTSSSTSSVSVSDIKDALALIANAIPDWSSSATSESTEDSDAYVPCGEIAGVYQVVETVNEYDDIEVGSVGAAIGLPECNGGIAYLEILPGCSWSYKKVSVGQHWVPNTAPIYYCEDDSGTGVNGVVEHENEFCRINRVAQDNLGVDFKFTIERVENKGPWVIQGIKEKNAAVDLNGDPLFRGPGCDSSFEGHRVSRRQITPCKDRCYSSSNGDFEQGYFNWASDLERVNQQGLDTPIGNPDIGQLAIASLPKEVNKFFRQVPCPSGFCLYTSLPDDSAAPVATPGETVMWSQYYPHLGEEQCCQSRSYRFYFDAVNLSPVANNQDSFQVSIDVGNPSFDTPAVFSALPMEAPAAGNVVTPTTAYRTYVSQIFTVGAAAGGATLAITYNDAGSNDVRTNPVGFGFDNFRVQCAGYVSRPAPAISGGEQ